MSRRILWIGIAGVWLVGFIAAVAAPPDTISSSRLIKMYVQLMSPISDPRALLATSATFPEVTRLYYSIVIWSLPLWIIVLWRWLRSQVGVSKTGLMFKQPLTFLQRAALLLLAAPFCLALVFASTLNNGGDTRLAQLSTSRIQLAVFGMVFQIATAAAITFFVFCILRALSSKDWSTKHDHGR